VEPITFADLQATMAGFMAAYSGWFQAPLAIAFGYFLYKSMSRMR
jgi:hypothetical protein